MELTMQAAGKKGGKLEVSDVIFSCEYKEALIHQVVTAQLAGERSGNSAQKSRSEVRGGGAKPFRQKGTGRARAGTIRSPLWRTGGVTFARKPRDYSQKVNKKMYRVAMRSILSELYRQERLIIADEFTVTSPRTKELVAKLKEWSLEKVLIITETVDENLYLAARNIPHIDVCDVSAVDPIALVACDKVLMTVPAVKLIEERLV